MSTAAPQLGSRSASTSSLHALAAVPTSRTAAQLESSSAHELGAIEFGTDKEGRATLVGGGSSSMDDVPLDDAFELFGAQQGEQQGAAMPPELNDWAFLERTPSPVPSAALAALDADQRATVDGAQDVLFTAHGGAEREREQDESLAHVIDDGAGLLRQFTSAFSPSPKGASSTLSGRVEGGGAARALRGSADAEEDSVALRVGGRTVRPFPLSSGISLRQLTLSYVRRTRRVPGRGRGRLSSRRASPSRPFARQPRLAASASARAFPPCTSTILSSRPSTSPRPPSACPSSHRRRPRPSRKTSSASSRTPSASRSASSRSSRRASTRPTRAGAAAPATAARRSARGR